MDLGGHPSNVDLAEAPRLVMPSGTPSSTSNSSQIQPPPFSMIMQQAVAMQQFQFQQALLMQQVMATQQAAARAANVKSAAEMAAARAAEISKQLKGSDAVQDPVTGNTATASPNRSKSPSRSRSASRSKSRSPIRYRRDRSVSRSPIRYRRDRVSPSRVRDHYGYRSRSRRGYYRGRGDYSSWNPYRRDWDREREREREYYPRSRRSRSRSRSRVRRRSRTRSRSPWHRREFTLSPRHRRDDLSGTRIPRRSRSKDLKESPSGSSRSGSRSPYKKVSSRSPKAQRDSALVVEELDDGDQERKLPLSSHGGEVEGHPDLKKQSLKKDSRQKELSMSPIRSLSISLSPSKGLHPTLNGVSQSKLEDGNDDQVFAGGEAFSDMLSISEVRVDSKEQHSSPILTEESKTFKVNLRLKLPKQDLASRQSRLFRRVERHGREIDVSASYESDDDNAVDDWRDDMKAHEHDKSRRRESKDPAQKAEESNPKVGGQCVAPLGFGPMPLLKQEYSTLDQSMGPEKRYQEEEDDEALPKKSVPFPLLGDTEKEASLVTSEVEYNLVINDRNSHQHSGQGGVVGKVVAGNNTIKVPATDDGVADHEDKEEKDEFVFEGPKPPCVAHDVAQSELEKDRENAGHVKGKLLDAEIGHNRDSRGRQQKNVMEDGHGQKVKGMSRSKDEKKLKEDADQRKERHRKHKRKSRREEDVDDEEDEEEMDECDGRKEKRRHRKKHKREEDDVRRDRKKKKHKHRIKFPSDSPGKSPIFNTGEAGDAHVSPVPQKKAPGRHKKRRRVASKSLPGSASPTK